MGVNGRLPLSLGQVNGVRMMASWDSSELSAAPHESRGTRRTAERRVGATVRGPGVGRGVLKGQRAWFTLASALAKPLAQSWSTWARSLASGLELVQDGPGPPPDISSLHGPS